MSNLEKMLLNFGDFAQSPIGIGLAALLFIGTLLMVTITKNKRCKNFLKTPHRKKQEAGQKLVTKVADALNGAAKENQYASIRIRTINHDICRRVVAECTNFQPKSYIILEVEVRPFRDPAIMVRQGQNSLSTNQLDPEQLGALCEAVKRYDPVEALW